MASTRIRCESSRFVDKDVQSNPLDDISHSQNGAARPSRPVNARKHRRFPVHRTADVPSMASLHAISRRLRLGEDRVAHRAFSGCFAGLVVCTVMAATEKGRLLRLAVGVHDIADVAIDHPAPVHNPAAVERIPFYVKSLSRCNISRNNSSSSSSSAFSRYPSSNRMQVFQEPGVPWVPLAPLGDSDPSHGEPGPPSRGPLHAAEAVPCEAFAQPGLARAGKARLDALQPPCARSAPATPAATGRCC